MAKIISSDKVMTKPASKKTIDSLMNVKAF
jgi:hypothetical protein